MTDSTRRATTRSRRLPPGRWATALIVAAGFVVASCALGPERPAEGPPTAAVYLRAVDEEGRALPYAEVAVVDTHGDREVDTTVTDRDGWVRLEVSDPAVVVVSADGHLDEPVVIGPTDGDRTVRLWNRIGHDGRPRTSMHFGGDVMLGRRYLEPELSTPSVEDADDARNIVRHLAPLSEAADWTVVNLESVVGDLPDQLALTGKRFLLRSTPHVVDALDEMGVDLVTLGNNHAYDWGEQGLVATFAHLEAAGIDHVGAGFSRENAVRGRLDEVGGVTVGTISVTTVNGSYVNDQLPTTADPVPAELPEEEAWQYEERTFGFTGPPGSDVEIPVDDRRIGEAWRLFDDLEPDLDEAVAADVWHALGDVYPELQDWVARRGHGGAAPYRAAEVEAEIKRLRDEGADFVVLQVHGGYQFAEVASSFVRRIGHRAVDAGADLVVGHHPHVLQGVEWHGDGLIVHSLGNLLFDQDFLSTFPSALLRVVTDGDELLEARLAPVMLDRYRPKPVAGPTATAVLRLVDHRSALAGSSERIDGTHVGTVVDAVPPPPAGGAPPRGPASTPAERRWEARIRREGSSGVIERDRPVHFERLDLAAGEVRPLPECGLVRSDLLADGVELGVDLFDWGEFGDDAVSGQARLDDDPDRRWPLNWRVPRDPARWSITEGPSQALFDRALRLETAPNHTTTVRIAARVDLDRHRLFDAEGAPLDGEPELQLAVRLRRQRGEVPSARLVTFDFDDTDPTSDPSSERLAEYELPLDVPADGRWHEVVVDLPADLLEPTSDGHVANTANLLIDAPPSLRGIVDVDRVQLLEWRGRVDTSTAIWLDADHVRSSTTDEIQLTLASC